MRKLLAIILLSLTVLLFVSPPGVFAETVEKDDVVTDEQVKKEEIDPSQYQPQLIIENKCGKSSSRQRFLHNSRYQEQQRTACL